MKKNLLLLVAAAALLFSACAGNKTTKAPYEKGLDSITIEMSKLYVETLADDRFEGRKAGTPGLVAASEQIAAWLEEIGAVPFFDGSYYQIFDTAQVRELGVSRRAGGFEVRNVVGKIEGVNPDEYVFVGAHYDHVGMNPNLEGDDKIFNGADDNATGVGGVLQVARAFMASGEKPQRTVVFAFWDAEEMGLVGSRCFGATFEEMDKTKAYFNIDMIGRDERGTGGQVAYYSTDTIPFAEIVKDDAAGYGLAVEAVTDPEVLVKEFPAFIVMRELDGVRQAVMPGNSDYVSFQRAGVPVYFFFTGTHPDYHRVTDEAHKIDWQKMTDISKLSYLTLYRLANPGAEIVYPEAADKDRTVNIGKSGKGNTLMKIE